jgi:hypothetical protein
MDGLQNELAELKGFIAELKADRAAQKEKEQREAWTKYTSLSLVFIAVLAAIATQWAGKYGSRVLVKLNDSTFHQAKASDQWAFYQAKSIKENLYEVARDQAAHNGTAGAATEAAAKPDPKMTDKISRYEAEKKEIKEKAEGLEKDRDRTRDEAALASAQGSGMGLAVSVFQISIAMGSICLVTKKKPLWYLSLALALAATGEMIRVWLL